MLLFTSQVVSRLEAEISEYQHRIEQDAAAICSLEERLNIIVKRNRDYDSELAALTQQNNGKSHSMESHGQRHGCND